VRLVRREEFARRRRRRPPWSTSHRGVLGQACSRRCCGTWRCLDATWCALFLATCRRVHSWKASQGHNADPFLATITTLVSQRDWLMVPYVRVLVSFPIYPNL
jgi:hypothetical protein